MEVRNQDIVWFLRSLLLGHKSRDLIILLLLAGVLSRAALLDLPPADAVACWIFQVTACKQMLWGTGVALCSPRNSSYLEGERERETKPA